jgi:hypothetical protein
MDDGVPPVSPQLLSREASANTGATLRCGPEPGSKSCSASIWRNVGQVYANGAALKGEPECPQRRVDGARAIIRWNEISDWLCRRSVTKGDGVPVQLEMEKAFPH